MQLLDTHAVGVRREKMYQLDSHIACAVAGITGEEPSSLQMYVNTTLQCYLLNKDADERCKDARCRESCK
jgi:20S proteasome alpha/beta subunit